MGLKTLVVHGIALNSNANIIYDEK